jgi:hypothetical protein
VIVNARDNSTTATVSAKDVAKRVKAIEWAQVSGDLDAQGSAVINGLIFHDAA